MWDEIIVSNWFTGSCNYWGWQISKPARWAVKLETQESWWFSFSTWKGISLLILFRPSTDWMRLTLIVEGNLPYLFYQMKCYISSKNTFTDKARIMFDKFSGHSVAQSNWQIKLMNTVYKGYRILKYLKTFHFTNYGLNLSNKSSGYFFFTLKLQSTGNICNWLDNE